MKINIVYLLLITLLGIIVSASIAQQNQNVPKTDTEVEKLKIQLQTVENEKIGLETKLAEAQAKHAAAYAKLIKTEFDKLKLELKDSNEKWLTGWILFFLAILSAVGAVLWSWLTSKMDNLIADGIEKRLDGFEEAVGKVNILEDELRVLQREHAASVLENFMLFHSSSEYPYPEKINALSDAALLDVFEDETRRLTFRHKAAEVLADRKSTQFVTPALDFLNSVLDSDEYNEAGRETKTTLRQFVNFIGMIHTSQTYQGLTNFLNRLLLLENTELKDLFLTWTVFSLAYIGNGLNMENSVTIMKKAIPHLNVSSRDEDALNNLVEYFAKFQEHEGIKEILTNGLTDNLPDVEKQCLELLQEHDPDFVKEWKAQKATANTESEESDESKPTT